MTKQLKEKISKYAQACEPHITKWMPDADCRSWVITLAEPEIYDWKDSVFEDEQRAVHALESATLEASSADDESPERYAQNLIYSLSMIVRGADVDEEFASIDATLEWFRLHARKRKRR